MGFGDKKGSLQILFGGLVNPIIFVFAISQYLSVGCYTNITVTKDKPFFLADYLLSVIFSRIQCRLPYLASLPKFKIKVIIRNDVGIYFIKQFLLTVREKNVTVDKYCS